jgi:serine/threonine-protein kinase
MLDKSTLGEEVIKVLDFGVAKAPAEKLEDESTKSGTLLGTPQYMAPEQARGLPDVDHRADLWSVAVIAYQALTGELPFKGDTVTDIVVNICTEPPTPPSQLRPDLPNLVDQFFETAFRTEKDRRFQSARQLTQAFFQLTDASMPSLGTSLTMNGIGMSGGRSVSAPRIPVLAALTRNEDDEDDDENDDEDDEEVTGFFDRDSLLGPPSSRRPLDSFTSMPFDTYPTHPPSSVSEPIPTSQPSVNLRSVSSSYADAATTIDADAPRQEDPEAELTTGIRAGASLEASEPAAKDTVPVVGVRTWLRRDYIAVGAVICGIAVGGIVAMQVPETPTRSESKPSPAATMEEPAPIPSVLASAAPQSQTASAPAPQADEPAPTTSASATAPTVETSVPVAANPVPFTAPTARAPKAQPEPKAAPKPPPGDKGMFDRY